MTFEEFDGLVFRPDMIVTVGPPFNKFYGIHVPRTPMFRVKFQHGIEQSFTYNTMAEATRMREEFVKRFCIETLL